jgi:hypothetical protein
MTNHTQTSSYRRYQRTSLRGITSTWFHDVLSKHGLRTDVATIPALNLIVYRNNASVSWPARMVFSVFSANSFEPSDCFDVPTYKILHYIRSAGLLRG